MPEVTWTDGVVCWLTTSGQLLGVAGSQDVAGAGVAGSALAVGMAVPVTPRLVATSPASAAKVARDLLRCM
jgi:hypothetical protein